MRAGVLVAVAVVVGLSLTAVPSVASACRRLGPHFFQLGGSDLGPPLQPRAGASLERGKPGSFVPSNCSSLAVLDIRVHGILGRDQGYYLRLVDGAWPDGFPTPARPFARDGGGTIRIYWYDVAVMQRGIDFTFEVVPVNAAGVLGPPSDPVRVTAPAGHAWFLWLLLAWPLYVLVRHAGERRPLDYYTLAPGDGSRARLERDWFVAPGRLGVGHYRFGLALHTALVLVLMWAALWLFGRFGVVTWLLVAAGLQVYARRAARPHRPLLSPSRAWLRAVVAGRVRARASEPISVEEGRRQPVGAVARVRGRVRCPAGTAYRRQDVREGADLHIHEWIEPFELVDGRGQVIAVDLGNLWVVTPPARGRIQDGDELIVTGALEHRTRGVGRGAHPYSGDLVTVTLAPPERGAVIVALAEPTG